MFMMAHILQKKDFWAGTLYIVFGVAGYWIGQNYPMGSAARMGAGFFPAILSLSLVCIGLLSVGRSIVWHGETVQRIAWKPLFVIVSATILFGIFLQFAGLIVALFVLVLATAAASRHFRFDIKAVFGLVLLIAFCALVFVVGLGVPMPLFGPM
jgi:hypothetical protein